MALAPDATLTLSVARSVYRYRLPGALTDSMFHADARAATRSRNWYSPDITIPSARLDWRMGDRTRLTAQATAVTGDRNSVQFVGFANVPDAVSPTTGTYAARQVDIDNFMTRTGELRLTHEYAIGSRTATLAAGVAAANNDMRRRQQGRGTTGSDYDLSLATGDFARDMHFKSQSAALYAENLLQVTPRWSIVPGFRLEHGDTKMTGRLAYYDPANIPHSVDHTFPLFGLRTEYQSARGFEAYGGWSQAYRPMILKDLLPESALERTDANIKDANGWTVEAGVRGARGQVSYDVSTFAMRYNDRFGSVASQDANGTAHLFKTNVGSTMTKGLELRVDISLVERGDVSVRAFNATAYYDAKYVAGTVVDNGVNKPIEGMRVEGVPDWTSRNGITVAGSRYSATILASHVAAQFADPLTP